MSLLNASTPAVAASPYQADGHSVTQAAFTQIACNPAYSVVVEACAGSGKTWLLVARMLRLLLAGAQPQELLAITFTRKAAEEMRSRLLDILAELAQHPEAEVLQALQERGLSHSAAQQALPLARGLYAKVLASPASLSIDTFHGWFASLLRGAPLSTGIPQGYALREDGARLQREAWQPFWRALSAPEHTQLRQHYETLLEEVGAHNADKLLNALFQRRAEWWALQETGEPLALLEALLGDVEADPIVLAMQNNAMLERAWRIAQGLGQGTKVNQRQANELEHALTAAKTGDRAAQHAAFAALSEICYKKTDGTAKLKLNKDLQAGLADTEQFLADGEYIAQAIHHAHAQAWEAKVLRINSALFPLASALMEVYQQHKAVQRVLDFNDMEWLCARLMGQAETAAYLQMRLDARYKHILLDEFQDTNPLQWRILQGWLAGYQDAVAEKPTLFLVGDPKQSIYRFRGADARLFEAAAQHLVTHFEAKRLRTSSTRRNAPAVLNWVNAVFNTARAQGLYSQYTPQSTLWQGAASNPAAQGRTYLLPLIPTPDKPVVDEATRLRDTFTPRSDAHEASARYAEGVQVAAVVQQLRATESVHEGKQERPAKWSDFKLLVRRRAHLLDYERAFREAGIPCVSPRKGGLLTTLEALDLIALLNFLMTPEADLALAQVLKSPIASLGEAGDAVLIHLAQSPQHGSWWQRLQTWCVSGQAPLAVAEICQRLQAWQAIAAHLPVHDVLDHVYHSGALKRRYATAVPAVLREQVQANLDAFLKLALDLDGGRYPSLPKFIAELQDMQRGSAEESPDEGDFELAEEGDATDGDAEDDASTDLDAVQILTIHAAKGLEAPFVGLLDTQSGGANDNLGILLDWPPDASAPTHLSAYGSKKERGVARQALFDEEARIQQRENFNLLYVAMTRAQQVLFVSGVETAKKNKGKEAEKAAAEGAEAAASPLSVARADTAASLDEKSTWYQRLAAAGVAETFDFVQDRACEVSQGGVAAQALLSQVTQAAELVPYNDFSAQLSPAVQASLALEGGKYQPAPAHVFDAQAAAQGEVLHLLLERLLRSPAATQGLATLRANLPSATQVAQWLGASHTASSAALAAAERIFANPELAPYFDAHSYLAAWNELEIEGAGTQQGQWLRIDRLVEHNDYLTVIDYKAKLLAAERADYAAQLAGYCAAVRQVRGDKPVRAMLVITNGEMVLFST